MLPFSAFDLKNNFQKAVDKNGAPFRVYGLCGDAHLQGLVLQSLLDFLLEADARDFNMDTLDGESATIADVMSRCGNLPFLAQRRVVVVSRAERLENLHKASKKDESDSDDATSDAASDATSNNADGDSATLNKATSSTRSRKSAASSPAKRLSEGLKNVPPMTVLVLQRTPESPELGAKASAPRCINAIVDKVFDEHKDAAQREKRATDKTKSPVPPDSRLGLLIDCTIDAKNMALVTQIIEQEAQRRAISLDRGAVNFLVERVGTNIAHLINELEKCSLRAGADQKVTTRIIDEMTERAPHEKIFELMDIIAAQNGARAIASLRELVGNGQAPEAILSILGGQLRKLLVARFLIEQNLPVEPNAVARLSPALQRQMPAESKNLPPAFPFLAGKLAAQARQFSTKQIQGALEAAFAVDLAMKGIEGDGGGQDSKDNSYLPLELFVAQLCARESSQNASQNRAPQTSSTRYAR